MCVETSSKLTKAHQKFNRSLDLFDIWIIAVTAFIFCIDRFQKTTAAWPRVRFAIFNMSKPSVNGGNPPRPFWSCIFQSLRHFFILVAISYNERMFTSVVLPLVVSSLLSTRMAFIVHSVGSDVTTWFKFLTRKRASRPSLIAFWTKLVMKKYWQSGHSSTE